jgi:hypothetical protein
MTFLSPALLGVLIPLAALPLVIHLLNKGFPRLFNFPSIELIKQTMAQRSRLHQWRHWILILLRTAFLLLLLLAFLRPVQDRFGVNPAGASGRRVLIVLDRSASMEHKGDGPTSRERAVHEANKLLESLGPDDVANVLLMDSSPTTCFVDFSGDIAEARRFVARLKPGLGRADVNQANASAARLLSKTDARSEVYYISDFQRKNWANVNFTSLPANAKLFFVDAGPARRDNRAIVEAKISQNYVLAGDTMMVDVTVGNYSAEAFAGRVTVTLDGRFSFDHEVSLSPWSEAKVQMPVSAGGPGVHLCEVRLPSDALEADNRYCLAISVQEKEEILLVTDKENDPRSGSFFLKTALNPYENEAGSLLPRMVPSGELSSTRLAGVRTIFISQINRLSADSITALGQFVFGGGGMIYFLDGGADGENLTALEKVIGAMPLRLARRHTATNVAAGAQQVVRGDFKSRYLKLFQGAARQNLSLLEFYDYYQASSSAAGGVLLWYADESPAMAAVHHGRGTLLLLNFSANELSSNLARQRIFPAWMQDLVKTVATDEPRPAAYTIGETLHTEVWRNEMRDGEFVSPAGTPVPVKRELIGERYSVTFTPEQLGFYTLGGPKPIHAFGVNGSPDEADLRPIEKDALPREFAAGREAHFVQGRDEFDELARGKPMFHWFILAACAVLVAESLFQLLFRARGRKTISKTAGAA